MQFDFMTLGKVVNISASDLLISFLWGVKAAGVEMGDVCIKFIFTCWLSHFKVTILYYLSLSLTHTQHPSSLPQPPSS